MPRKKRGLSRRKLQQLTKLTRLRRKIGVPAGSAGAYAIIQKEGSRDVKLIKVDAIGPDRVTKIVRKYKTIKPFVVPTFNTTKPVKSIAIDMVKASTQEVMLALGITPLEIVAKPEVLITPEVIHSVGRLVTTRAITMAHEYVVAGSPDGGGNMGAGGIIGAMSGSGVDVKISSTGEVSATVTRKSTKKSSTGKSAKTGKVTTTTSKKKDAKTSATNVPATVIKDKNGTINVFFQIDIKIDANIVHQMNVNPQEVKTAFVSDSVSLRDLIQKKVSELMSVDHKDDENDENDEGGENKPKKKKKKGEDDDKK